MHERYGDNDFNQKDVRRIKLVDLEGIAKHHKINIMLYEPKKDSEEGARSIWRLVYGKIQYKSDLSTVNIRLHGGHCFYIKKKDSLSKCRSCK